MYTNTSPTPAVRISVFSLFTPPKTHSKTQDSRIKPQNPSKTQDSRLKPQIQSDTPHSLRTFRPVSHTTLPHPILPRHTALHCTNALSHHKIATRHCNIAIFEYLKTPTPTLADTDTYINKNKNEFPLPTSHFPSPISFSSITVEYSIAIPECYTISYHAYISPSVITTYNPFPDSTQTHKHTHQKKNI